MAYFNHAFKKVFLATKEPNIGESNLGQPGGNAAIEGGMLRSGDVHVSKLKSTDPSEGYQIGPGVLAAIDPKTDLSLGGGFAGIIKNGCCPFYLANASIKINDKQGPFHGGYAETTKSKIINPKYINRIYEQRPVTGSQASLHIGATPIAGTCDKVFYCGETYNLRLEVKGTAALRFANHHLYQTFDAYGGCCADPSDPVAVNPTLIYKQWAEAITEDPYFKDFVRAFLIVDGDTYAATDALVAEYGLNAGNTFENAPDGTDVGIILYGSYVDTKFADCTFTPTDYYGKEPIQITASEVDLNGDPCTFDGVCVTEECPGQQAQGLGESKVRELLLSESYLQNFMHDDLRIREITQGTRVYEVLDRDAVYGSGYILHSIPRMNNPSSVFDNDQYLIEIIATAGANFERLSEDLTELAKECTDCMDSEKFDGKECDVQPLPVVLP